jgi:acyl-CoA thioesterase
MTLDAARAEAVRAKLQTIPISSSLGLRLDSLGDGDATITMPHRREYHGIFESLHGGLLITLADTTACVAILTKTGPDAVITTTDMNIRFLAPCLTDATAEARIIKFGRSLVPVNVMLRDAQGRDVAIAQVTYMRLEQMPSR